MKIEFIDYLPLSMSLVFESIYPENLQLDLCEKLNLKSAGAKFIWMRDKETGELVGETYYVPLDNIADEIVDTGVDDYFKKNAVYVYSTTILPNYQKQGLGKILKAYLLSHLKNIGVTYSLGHARKNGSLALNQYFGATVIGTQEDWCETGETVSVYVQEINSLKAQDKEWNCGAYATDFFLSLFGVPSIMTTIDSMCSEEDGIGHSAIEAVVKEAKLSTCEVLAKDGATIEELKDNLPAIINYQYDGDGHYGVALNIFDEFLELYNPYNGQIEHLILSDFIDNWYSVRYGKQWFLTLKSNG